MGSALVGASACDESVIGNFDRPRSDGITAVTTACRKLPSGFVAFGSTCNVMGRPSTEAASVLPRGTSPTLKTWPNVTGTFDCARDDSLITWSVTTAPCAWASPSHRIVLVQAMPCRNRRPPFEGYRTLSMLVFGPPVGSEPGCETREAESSSPADPPAFPDAHTLNDTRPQKNRAGGLLRRGCMDRI